MGAIGFQFLTAIGSIVPLGEVADILVGFNSKSGGNPR